MAEIIGGLSTSHVPMIGKAIAAGRQDEVSFKPFFDGYRPVREWVAAARPDVAVVIYNDHGLNFFLDTMPTFALGVARDYANADEGWGPPEPHVFPGAPRLAWHIADRSVADEFDIATCQEMLFDHAGVTALDLLWPDGAPVTTIPIVINAVQPPLPTPRRCYRLGQALGRAIGAYPEPLKVLVIGSGGLSHSLGQSGSINEDYDRRCMERMVSDPEALAALTNDEIVHEAGAQGLEILTWIAMRGAVAGDVELVASTYHAPISHTGGAMMLLDARRVAGLVTMRLIVGAAEAAVMPASYRWFRYNLPERHMGSAIGIFAMGNKLGTAIGAPLAAWLVVAYDWRLMFVITGLLGLIWLVPWMMFVKSDLPVGPERVAARRRASSVSFHDILVSPVVWGGIIVNFCYSYFVFYCMTWMPSYLVEQHGLSLAASGAYTFFSFIGIAVVAVAAGWAADRLIDRGADPVRTRKIFIVAGFAGATSVLLGAQTSNLGMALFWNIFSLSCLGLASANNLALTKVTLIPRPAIGLVTGVQHMAAGLSGGVAASLSGWLLHVSGSYTLPMMVIVLFLVIGAAASIVLLHPQWSPKVTVVA